MILTTDGQRSLPALFFVAYANDDYTPIDQAYRQILQYAQGSLVQVMQWGILCNEDWARCDVGAVAEAARGTYFADNCVDAR